MSKKVQRPQQTFRHTIAQKHRHSKFLINHKVAMKLPYGKGFNIKRQIIFFEQNCILRHLLRGYDCGKQRQGKEHCKTTSSDT